MCWRSVVWQEFLKYNASLDPSVASLSPEEAEVELGVLGEEANRLRQKLSRLREDPHKRISCRDLDQALRLLGHTLPQKQLEVRRPTGRQCGWALCLRDCAEAMVCVCGLRGWHDPPVHHLGGGREQRRRDRPAGVRDDLPSEHGRHHGPRAQGALQHHTGAAVPDASGQPGARAGIAGRAG